MSQMSKDTTRVERASVLSPNRDRTRAASTGKGVSVRQALSEAGYAVVHLDKALDDKDTLERASEIIAEAGQVLHVFPGVASMWTHIKADPEKPKEWTSGTGELPLHIDFVDAEYPPELTCILCLTADPEGGGQTIVSRFDIGRLQLPGHCRELLERAEFRESGRDGLVGLGCRLNSFAVLNPNAVFSLRYTGRVIRSVNTPAQRYALSVLSEEIERNAIEITLARSDLLLLDQTKVLHGRRPLGTNQELLDSARRRRISIAFARMSSSTRHTRHAAKPGA
jgi:hypothetical protein